MKEATGELNLTVVVVIAIASLTLFFYTVIWPMIKNNMSRNTKCSEAICEKEPNSDGSVNCYYLDQNGSRGENFTCVWKG